MANSNNWGEIYKSTWWGNKAWSANTLFIDSAPPGFGLNLLKASEDMDNTIDWRQVLSSVVANSTDEAAPDGTDTAEKITFTDDRQARIQQKIDLEANTTYTFSVYAKVRTGTKDFRLRNLTLGEQGAFTADTSWGLNPDDGRYSFSFTTGATAITHTLSIQNAAAAGTGEVFFWGAMLNEGATAGDYVKTDASVSGSAPAPAYSGFGDAFGGVTAYYSLRQFTEAETLNAIRVRRSSDDTEQDIGFDANGDLDTTALLAFVNEDVDTYTSDFSVNDNGWAAATDGGTAAGNIDGIGGQDDVLRFTVDTSTTPNHRLENTTILDGGYAYTIEFEYYIPSTNANLDSFRVQNSGGSSSFFTETDTWASGSFSNTNGSGGYLRFQSADGGTVNYTGNGTDVFYMKNIVVTQTTADGAVTTWYDQSGNGNDATNSTESEQPLVVSGGTLVEENSKAAIDFDGSQLLYLSSFSVSQPFTNFAVNKFTATNVMVYGSNDDVYNWWNRGARVDIYAGVLQNGATSATSTQQSLYSLFDGANSEVAVNNNTATSVNAGTNNLIELVIGSNTATAGLSSGQVTQELIIFDSDQSGNRTGMETNINDHFDIYP